MTSRGSIGSTAVLAFVLRAIGAVLAFAFNAAVARLLGASGAGLYFLSLSTMGIASVLARLGLDNALLRFVAANAAHDNWNQVAGVFRASVRLGLAASGLLALGCAALARPIARHIFGLDELADPLLGIAPGIVGFSLMLLIAAALRGLNRIRDSMLVSGVFYPVFGLLLLRPLVALLGPAGATLSYALATTLSAAAGVLLWRVAMSNHPAEAPNFSRVELARSMRPLWLVTVVNQAVLPWMPLLLLGFWATTTDAGIFGAATRLANLVNLFLVSVNSVLAPRIATLFVSDRRNELGPLVRRFALLIALATMPVFAALIFAAPRVLTIFGPGYQSGSAALVVLSIGQLVSVLCGSVGQLLIMTGYERSMRTVALWTAALSTFVAVATIPVYGDLGAALAVSVGVAFSNLASVFVARIRLGIVTIPFLELVFPDHGAGSDKRCEPNVAD